MRRNRDNAQSVGKKSKPIHQSEDLPTAKRSKQATNGDDTQTTSTAEKSKADSVVSDQLADDTLPQRMSHKNIKKGAQPLMHTHGRSANHKDSLKKKVENYSNKLKRDKKLTSATIDKKVEKFGQKLYSVQCFKISVVQRAKIVPLPEDNDDLR